MEGCKGSILIVDDDRFTRDLLSTNLCEAGYTVAMAEDGLQALTRLRDQPFDAVLLDLMMPVMDGFQVLERMREEDSFRHIPVIVVSALDEMESVIHSIRMGATDHLVKPFDPVFLHARIGAAVEKKRLRDREIHLFEQLQEQYRKLQESEKLQDNLIHMIVHDLRTPLTSILSGLLILEDLGETQEGRKEILSISIRGTKVLLGMINDLLDISKMEDGSLRLEYQELTPAEILCQAAEQVTFIAQNKDVRFLTDVAAELPTFAGDADKLVRTLVNLTGNAIRFTPPGGTVTIAARLASSERPDLQSPAIQFSVADTGEGIPGEAFDRIFDKFGQVESRQSGRKISTGLGLTFCRMAVEAHGGCIWVESKLGEGSIFSFTVPLQRPENAS